MLHSYARKTSYNGPGSDAMLEGTPPEGGSVEGVQREGGYSLALSMDFEIVTPDGDLVEPEGVEQVSVGVCDVCTCFVVSFRLPCFYL